MIFPMEEQPMDHVAHNQWHKRHLAKQYSGLYLESLLENFQLQELCKEDWSDFVFSFKKNFLHRTLTAMHVEGETVTKKKKEKTYSITPWKLNNQLKKAVQVILLHLFTSSVKKTPLGVYRKYKKVLRSNGKSKKRPLLWNFPFYSNSFLLLVKLVDDENNTDQKKRSFVLALEIINVASEPETQNLSSKIFD